MSIAERLTEHVIRLRRYALVLCRERDDAEELVQECLAKALASADTFRRDADLRAWLFGILHATYVGSARRFQRRVRAAEAVAAADPDIVPPAQIQRSELAAALRALAQLPEEQRQVLALIVIEGMTYEEAADILAIPVATVMARLGRGRERLRQLMGDGRGGRVQVVRSP